MSATAEEVVKALEGAFKAKVSHGVHKISGEHVFRVPVKSPSGKNAGDGVTLSLSFPTAALDQGAIISRFRKQNEDRMKEKAKLKGTG